MDFLVKAAADVGQDRLCQTISQMIPHAEVYTAQDFSLKSQYYWLARTGIAISFGAATVLGLIVDPATVLQE